MKEKHLTTHQRNLQLQMVKMDKAKTISVQKLQKVFFGNRSNYNLRIDNHLQLPKVMTRYAIKYHAHYLFSSLPK